jgi:hypothetical protein
MAKLIPKVFGFTVEGTPYVVEPYPHLLVIEGCLAIDRLEWIAYDPERNPRHRSSIRFDSLREAVEFWDNYQTPAERQRRESLALPSLAKQLRAA